MDWIQMIISAVAGLVGGSGLATVVTLRATRKKANAEADDTAIKALNEAISTLNRISEEKDEQLKEKDALIESLQTQMADKRCECTTKGYYMCVHQGCVLRLPSLGRGKAYFKAHEGEPSFGADFDPVEVLLERYRKKQQRKAGQTKKSKNADDGNNQ